MLYKVLFLLLLIFGMHLQLGASCENNAPGKKHKTARVIEADSKPTLSYTCRVKSRGFYEESDTVNLWYRKEKRKYFCRICGCRDKKHNDREEVSQRTPLSESAQKEVGSGEGNE